MAHLEASLGKTPHFGQFAITWGQSWGLISVPKWLRLWRAD